MNAWNIFYTFFSILAATELLTRYTSTGGHSALLTIISPLTSPSVPIQFVLSLSDMQFDKKYVNRKIWWSRRKPTLSQCFIYVTDLLILHEDFRDEFM